MSNDGRILSLTRGLNHHTVNPQTKEEAIELASGIKDAVSGDSPGDVGLFVPFCFIETVQEVAGDKFVVGAEVRTSGWTYMSCSKTGTLTYHSSFCVVSQMTTPELAGAFTGGISAVMLKSMGIEWALAGHSERRTINKETDEYINAQCKLLIENDMTVVLCIGETLEEFEKDLVNAVCEVQLKKGLADIEAEDMDKVVIAVSIPI